MELGAQLHMLAMIKDKTNKVRDAGNESIVLSQNSLESERVSGASVDMDFVVVGADGYPAT